MARLSFQMVLDFKKRFRFIILHLYFEEKVESRLADEVLPIKIGWIFMGIGEILSGRFGH